MNVRAALLILVMVGAASACTLPELKLVYPPMGAQARITGEVNVRVAYGDDGVPVITAATGHPLLKEASENAIRGAVTPSSCLGQSVEATVKFALLDCYSERPWSRSERVNETAWNAFAPTASTIACGEERVVRKFPFFFRKRSAGFCRRLPAQGPVCSSFAEAASVSRIGAASVR